MRSEQIYDGEWVHWGNKERFQCCSCGLVHDIEFKRVKGKLLVRMTVNNRSTGQAHRQMDNRAKTEAEK